MKEELGKLSLQEKEFYIKDGKKIVKTLEVWHDNNLCEAYLDDTIGIAALDIHLLPNGEIDDDYDGEFYAVWLTKHQAIILRSYLDNFIQLAETETELNEKKEV